MDVFGQRMTVILDHLSGNENSSALNEVNQVLGKKKTADKLSDKQRQILSLVKAHCLVKLNLYGEAAVLFDQFLNEYKEFDTLLQTYSKMFVGTAIYLGRSIPARKFFEEFYKAQGSDPKVAEEYLMLSVACWDLTTVQQLHMKSYKTSNNPLDCLASVYCQYLNLRREGAEYLKKPEPAKLKILKMFIPKIEKQIEEEKDVKQKNTLKSQLVFLKHDLLRDSDDLEELFTHIKANLEVFEFSEHLDTLSELAKEDLIWNKYENTIIPIFFDILESQLRDNTIANYNMQKRFLEVMTKRIDLKHFEKTLVILKEQHMTTVESFIKAFEILQSSHFLLRYLKMLASYLQKFMIENKDKFRSKNYLILTLDVFIAIVKQLGDEARQFLGPAIRHFVSTVVNYYKNTLTLIDELQHLFLEDEGIRLIVSEEIAKVLSENTSDNSLSCSLGYQKLLVDASSKDLDHVDEHKCLEIVNSFLTEYDKYDDIFYKDKKKIEIEKGDRLFNDNYLFAAIEVLRIIQNKQTDPIHQLKYRQILFILLEFSKRSPHNFDLMIRNLEVNNQLGFFEENYELFLKHDLKGNQYETLAYLFFKQIDNMPLVALATEYQQQALAYYRECEKEAVESFKSCCKHANFRVLWEFYLYERLNANSVYRIIVDKLFAEQWVSTLDNKSNQFEANLVNASSAIDANLAKLTRKDVKPAFNLDLVQCQLPKYFTKNIFNFDLIGPLKDVNVLRAETRAMRMMLNILQKKKSTDDDVKCLKADVEAIGVHNLLNFDQYNVFRRVNNPLVDLKATHAYGKKSLDWQMRIVKIGLEALSEFATLCAVLSQESESAFVSLEGIIGTPKLEALQVELEKNIPQLCISKHSAIDENAYFAVFYLLQKARVIAIISKVGGADVKAFAKTISKPLSETDKDSLSRTITAYNQLKDYLKEKIKQAETVLEQHLQDTELKTDLSQISWPTAVKNVLPKLTSTYSARFKSCLVDSQSRLNNMKKNLN